MMNVRPIEGAAKEEFVIIWTF